MKRKLSEEALPAHASVLRRRDQNCIFHHKCAISPYKGSYESIHTFTSTPIPLCIETLRAGRCHTFGFLAVLTSFPSQPGWTAVVCLPSPGALQVWSQLTPLGRTAADILQPPALGTRGPITCHRLPWGLRHGDLVCWLMQIPRRDSSQQSLVMSHGAQPRVTRDLGQAHHGTTLCFPIPGQIPSLLHMLNNIYLLEELHQFLQS